MYHKKISVIMGVYNQWDEKILHEAVYSILSQSESDFEFIIYDDGSKEQASENIKALKNLDDRIVVIGSEENRGLAFALNACIEKAQGKYIARMDADDKSHPARFEKQVEFLENHPEYSWCGCSAELFDDEGIWGERIYPEIPDKKHFLKYSPYIHPSVMYRAEIFEKAGTYNTSKETLRCEDYDIFMRLHELGYRGYNIQETLFCYREDQAAYNKRKFKYRISEMRIRYRHFKKMKMLFPTGWVYVLRPVLSAIVPNQLILQMKRKKDEKPVYNEAAELQENPSAGAGVSAGSKQIQRIP